MEDLSIQESLVQSALKLLGETGAERLSSHIRGRQEHLGISKRQMCRVLQMSGPSMDRILDGEAQKIDVLTLLKLSSFLDMEFRELVRSYVAGASSEEVGELESTRERSYIVSNFDLEGLRDVGFINSITKLDAIRDRITSFFGLDSIFDYRREVARPLFSSMKRDARSKMKEFWVRSAYCQFEKRPNPNEYDRQKLLELVPQIRQYTRYEQVGLRTVARALYEAGVTVIAQKKLSYTQVRGGTFVVDGKPCIVVTDYQDDYGTVWFALLHELAHVIYHLDTIQSYTYHLSDEVDDMLIEEEANYFARELLLPEDKLDYIEPLIENPKVVERYAKKIDIHPSLIYSFYAYRKYTKENDSSAYSRFSKKMKKANVALDPIRCNPWQNETIVEDIDKTLDNISG